MKRRLELGRPAVATFAVLAATFSLGACGTLRIHRPQDQTNAVQAQSQFQAADLAQAIVAERTRLAQVLTDELDLVRQHTLARRDARLLYVIGKGDNQEAWNFLEADLEERLEQLGFKDKTQLKDRLRRDVEAKRQLGVLDTSGASYETERKSDRSLPALTCPLADGVTPPPEDSMAIVFWNEYQAECKKYLEIVQGQRAQANGNGTPRRPLDQPLANGAAIQAMQAAKQAAEDATAQARKALDQARAAHVKQSAAIGQPANREKVRQAAKAFIERAEDVRSKLEAFVNGDSSALNALGVPNFGKKVDDARTELSDLGLDLSSVVGDLSSVPLVAKLETARAEVVAGLSSTLQGETADKVFDSLQAIDVALSGPTHAPITAMVLKEKQLQLDIAAARNRANFFDKTLALLELQEAAYRNELAYLGQAELRRQELVRKGCLADISNANTPFLNQLFTDRDPAVIACREIVFRLLVQYSAAWTFGRVDSEQADYKIIALHHESALDTSDIAFQKWVALLSPSIDQLVAFSETGIKPADIVTPIVNALGLGAVAAGVN